MFPVTKGRDISGADEVSTETKVDSILSVNWWQYPNNLAPLARLLSYRLKVNFDRSLSTTKKNKTKKWLRVAFWKWSQSVLSETPLEQSWNWVYQDGRMQSITEKDLSEILHLIEKQISWQFLHCSTCYYKCPCQPHTCFKVPSVLPWSYGKSRNVRLLYCVKHTSASR